MTLKNKESFPSGISFCGWFLQNDTPSQGFVSYSALPGFPIRHAAYFLTNTPTNTLTVRR
jgi:hypothetical protein